MSDKVETIIEDTSSKMSKGISHLELELLKIRAGKADPTMLHGIFAEYYGNPTPIDQVANVSVQDARTLNITPWEKSMLSTIERAIMSANIGINPQNDGNSIRLFLPPLTEERRKELVKRCNVEGENSKITIRNIRREGIEEVKREEKDGLSEDESRDAEASIQDLTDKYIVLIDKHLQAKETEIMSV